MKKLLIGIVVVFFVFLVFLSQSPERTVAAVPAVPLMSESEYKTIAKSYSYKDIARNPNDFIGNKAFFTGEVIQVGESESGKTVGLRVNVTKGNYFYSDTIYVNYIKKDINESRILEHDIIKFYGDLAGIKKYTSIFGAEVSIPQVNMKYFEVIK